MIYLSIDDQKKIWAPQIVIGSNMVSKTKDEEEFGVQKTLYTYPHHCEATKKFYLRTSVICDMHFDHFPFDKHVCNLEVSFKLLKTKDKFSFHNLRQVLTALGPDLLLH